LLLNRFFPPACGTPLSSAAGKFSAADRWKAWYLGKAFGEHRQVDSFRPGIHLLPDQLHLKIWIGDLGWTKEASPSSLRFNSGSTRLT
jgi:hypothetical protein